MKILVVVDSLRAGGAENLVLSLARAAPEAGFEVEIASLAGSDAAGVSPVFDLGGVKPRFLSMSSLADPRTIPKLVDAIRRSRCDLVHAHLAYSATLAPPAARWAGRPSVCTFHHVPGPLSGREALRERLAVAVARRSAGLVFVSQASMEAFAARYRMSPGISTVIPNGVDLSRFSPDPATFPADLGIPPGAPVAVMVARMDEGKGHAAAIAAWPSVLSRVPEAYLLFVGSGPAEPELNRQAVELGIAFRVIFAGFRSDVPALLRASTLAVLSSESEALPTTLIEAAACGRATVATRVGGVPEVVVDGETGILVAPGDQQGLGDAVGTLLIDRQRREAMGRAARRLAEERFGLRVWCRRLRALYEQVISNGGQPPAG